MKENSIVNFSNIAFGRRMTFIIMIAVEFKGVADEVE